MGKSQKNVSKHQNHNVNQEVIDMPDIMTIDQLGEVTDDELHDRIRGLRQMIDSSRKNRVETRILRTLEEELCFADREAQLRRERKAAHQSYLESIGEFDEPPNEADLPSADLDNSSFVALFQN